MEGRAVAFVGIRFPRHDADRRRGTGCVIGCGGGLGPEELAVYVWAAREARFSVETWDGRG
ncbi:hypothetical protein [Streptomyces sp. NBC_01276]|uniref:hypothetical protein n=1 Tax=Streptomyces sp. NBC_01276 TaxID=2903808 RepID=UPI00352D56BD